MTAPDWLPADWTVLPDGSVQTVANGILDRAEALILRDLIVSRSLSVDANKRRPAA
jgi:hypothetical protein